VLRVKLDHLDRWTAGRRERARRYRDLLTGIAEVELPPVHRDHVYNQFVVRVPDRDRLRADLARSGIGTEVYYPEPLHLQPCFADLGYRGGGLPVAERACREVLALPIHAGLTPASQERVADHVRAFYR
jgi:dTDP-4-amino-4,6-dideoxygalactose transaminase